MDNGSSATAVLSDFEMDEVARKAYVAAAPKGSDGSMAGIKAVAAAVRERVEAPLLARIAELEADLAAIEEGRRAHVARKREMEAEIVALSESLADRVEVDRQIRVLFGLGEVGSTIDAVSALMMMKKDFTTVAAPLAINTDSTDGGRGEDRTDQTDQTDRTDRGDGYCVSGVKRGEVVYLKEGEVAAAVQRSPEAALLDWIRAEVVQASPSPIELTKLAKSSRYAALWKRLYHG